MDVNDMFHLVPTVFPKTMEIKEDKDHELTADEKKE